MSFAQPLFLLGLLGALVPIIIHLIHRRRPRKQAFSAIELVIRSVQRVERSWRLRRFLLLAARVLLVAALALAAARPLWGPELTTTQARSGPERLAVIVDATLSMRAQFDGATAFSRAVVQARNQIDAMGPEDMAVLVAAGTPARLLVDRPTADKALLLRRLGSLTPSFSPGDMGEAVTAAVQALAVAQDSPPVDPESEEPEFSARVVVLSDLAQSSFQTPGELQVPSSNVAARLAIVDVLADVPAAERRNRAVTALEAVPVPDRTPRTVEVRARIQSFDKERPSDAPTPVDVTLKENDQALEATTTDVKAGTIVDKVIRHSFEAAGIHPVVVDVEPDALTDDDRRFAKVDVRRQVRVLVVDGAPSGVPKEDEIFYLERALQAGAADQPAPRIIGADDLPRADLSAFDVVILAGVDIFNRTEGPRLTDFVERGGGLLITASGAMDADLYNAELGRALPRPLRGLKETPEDTPGSSGQLRLAPPDAPNAVTEIFSGDALGGLLSTKTRAYWLLEPATEPAMSVILRYEDGQPALVTRNFGAGRVAVLTTSIDRDLTDLPIRPAFVPLIRQVVLHLGRALEAPDNRRTLVDQPRVIRVPDGARRMKVEGPDGREVVWDAPDLANGRVTFEGARQPGFYFVFAAFAGSMEPIASEHFAVNVDTRESDLQPLSAEEAQAILLGEATEASASPKIAAAAGFGRGFDPETLAAILLMMMALAFMAESALSALR